MWHRIKVTETSRNISISGEIEMSQSSLSDFARFSAISSKILPIAAVLEHFNYSRSFKKLYFRNNF